jgi:hypothetical protein
LVGTFSLLTCCQQIRLHGIPPFSITVRISSAHRTACQLEWSADQQLLILQKLRLHALSAFVKQLAGEAVGAA